MTGQVLRLSVAAACAIAVIIALWYLVAAGLLERLTPTSVEQKVEEEKRGSAHHPLVSLLRFFLDGYLPSAWLARAARVSVFVFARLPGLVFILGAYEGWVVMPSFPVSGTPGLVMRAIELAVALRVLSGLIQVALGVELLLVYTGLCVRFGLGGGFFLLGLVNKIYDAELFIGVGDCYPHLIAGPQHLFPWLTREAWSFTTALGEMTVGLLLLLGIFSRLPSLALALIFGNFILVFGWAEIVHLYPIAGFAVLFFHASPGTALDGVLFRAHVRAWRAMGYRTSFLLYRASVFVVAVAAGARLMFGPLNVAVQVVPRLVGHLGR